MKSIKNTLIHWGLMALSFFFTLWLIFIVYASFTPLTPVWTGSWLTSGAWNQMITNLNDLDTRVNNLWSVPSWAILMFNTSCPATWWTRVSALDNKFPMWSANYGTTGWADTHIHAAGTLLWPLHNHMWWNYISTTASDQTYNAAGVLTTLTASVKSSYYSFVARVPSTTNNQSMNIDAYTNNAWNWAVTGNTASSSNIPAYVTVVYCSKN